VSVSPQCIPDEPSLNDSGNDDNQRSQYHFEAFADQTTDKHVYAIAKDKQGGEPAHGIDKYLFHMRILKRCDASGK